MGQTYTYRWIVEILREGGERLNVVAARCNCPEQLLVAMLESAYMAPPSGLHAISHVICSDELTIYRCWYHNTGFLWPDVLIAVRSHEKLARAVPCLKPAGVVGMLMPDERIGRPREGYELSLGTEDLWADSDGLGLPPGGLDLTTPHAAESGSEDLEFGRADGPYGGWKAGEMN